ncbi:MAG: GNAT family N-acetyltransferase [Spirochaetales bacterium]|nr:GNAT family N-acetyltransferase [Spirochaetales bacterium]
MSIDEIKKQYPEKFPDEEQLFSHIHRGDRIFIHSACAEPQYLITSLVLYGKKNPTAFSDTELLSRWNLGASLFSEDHDHDFLRHNSFFISEPVRSPVNNGLADYTPVFLSKAPQLFSSGHLPVDVALIQVSFPDEFGFVNLGVSVDIVPAAIEAASIVIAQCNSNVPRVPGDGFLHIRDIDFLVFRNERLHEFSGVEEDATEASGATARIGEYVSQLVSDGDTIQAGYGVIPNAIMPYLSNKKNLGVHTELLGPGIIGLIKQGIVDNSMKTIDRGKTVASFCMGTQETYGFLHDNPGIEFRTIDYTNDPLLIARHRRMTAINSALQIDLTGQASAESIGKAFHAGIGGYADFMRGAVLAPEGKSILALHSTARDGSVSRIVPFLGTGAGVTLNRGDIHYVVTEYGIAYLHGRNIRERAMQLVSVAHPKFRAWLFEEARSAHLIHKDQVFIPGERGVYPAHYEIWRTTKKNCEIFIRPVKISDESLLKDFFHNLSDSSRYRRFMTVRKEMSRKRLQEFSVVDYSRDMIIAAVLKKGAVEKIVGIGQYVTDTDSHMAETAFVVRDDYQRIGIGTELLKHLVYIAKSSGLLGFTADVLIENRAMIILFEKHFPDIRKHFREDICELVMHF